MNTPEPLNGNDAVFLDLDRPRELRLGHKALKRFSALAGCSMEEMEEAFKDYDKMTCLIYVMLSQEDPSLTPEQVDDLLDGIPVYKLIKTCSQAVAAAFTDPDDGAQEADPPPAAGTGMTASA